VSKLNSPQARRIRAQGHYLQGDLAGAIEAIGAVTPELLALRVEIARGLGALKPEDLSAWEGICDENDVAAARALVGAWLDIGQFSNVLPYLPQAARFGIQREVAVALFHLDRHLEAQELCPDLEHLHSLRGTFGRSLSPVLPTGGDLARVAPFVDEIGATIVDFGPGCAPNARLVRALGICATWIAANWQALTGKEALAFCASVLRLVDARYEVALAGEPVQFVIQKAEFISPRLRWILDLCKGAALATGGRRMIR
jgi:hypothetical protein